MGAMELRPDSHGKVRDIYDCGDSLLMVASDRISAFDFILPDEIPYKGEILTRISAFWFDKFSSLVPNHLVSMDVADYPEEYQRYADYLVGRSMLVKKAQTVPVEAIVRGYLTGSVWTRPPSSPIASSLPPPRPPWATTTRTSRSTAARSW